MRREALAVGLEINLEKTECMLFNLPQETEIFLEGRRLIKASSFKYLGSRIPSTDDEISHRIALAWHAYWQLGRIWRSGHIPTKLKVDTFKASVISV